MHILFQQFLGKNHSWSVFGWGMARALKGLGHKVDLFSTDGVQYLPKDLKENLIGYWKENSPTDITGKLPDNDYNAQISYTALKNFPNYLSHGNKNRFGVWCYEWAGKNVLPVGFAKNSKYCDTLCAPSEFAKKVFMDSGISENIIKVIPHGIDDSFFTKTTSIQFKTKKKFKILTNIAQNHLRKNIPGILDAYGKAFIKTDDVCLILKGKNKEITAPFEVSLNDCLNDFYKKYPQHADIIMFNEFIEDISDLYRSVDCFFSMSFAEGFLFPALESIASGKLVIAPAWGGQLDFLNENNSLLIMGKEVRANPKSMYWESKPNAIWFQPSVDDAVDKLKFAYSNFEQLNKNIITENIKKKYSWNSVANEFLGLCT